MRTGRPASAPRKAFGRQPGHKEVAMYTTIRQYLMPDPQVVEEIVRRATADFAPRIREAPGFVAWYLVQRGRDVLVSPTEGNLVEGGEAPIAPREPDVLMSVSIFETQAQAHASTQLAVEWIQANIAEFLPNPPTITAGEVVAHAAP